MHNYSNEFFVKISKPKMSSRPMKVSLFYLLFFLVDLAAVSVCTEIDALIFYTIQLNKDP